MKKPKRAHFLKVERSWSERSDIAQKEYEARRQARKNEPGLKMKLQMKVKFNSMFGWLAKLFDKGKLPLLALPLLLQSCMVAQSGNGDKLTMFATNTGFTTETIRESNSQTGGIPFLGGSYGNDILHDTTHAEQQSVVNVGGANGITVTGIVDQGTPTNQSLGWVWRITRTVVTGQVFKVGLNGFFDNEAAKTAADVTKHGADTASKTTLGLAKERGALIPKVNPELVPIQSLKSP